MLKKVKVVCKYKRRLAFDLVRRETGVEASPVLEDDSRGSRLLSHATLELVDAAEKLVAMIDAAVSPLADAHEYASVEVNRDPNGGYWIKVSFYVPRRFFDDASVEMTVFAEPGASEYEAAVMLTIAFMRLAEAEDAKAAKNEKHH